ncbi:MAG: LbtU family siderophore porin [Proteobacteria bacterium]|nr:LbtU family siderophore porin [Pseudomonadota bacterium]
MDRKLRTGLLILLGIQANVTFADNAAQASKVLPEAAQATVGTQEGGPQFGQTYGPIQNQTLWSIARKLVKNTEFSIHQGVAAIRANNPQAFSNPNNHQIKANAVLTMPTRDQMTQIAPSVKQIATKTQTTAEVGTQYSADPEPLPGAGAQEKITEPAKTEKAQTKEQTAKVTTTTAPEPAQLSPVVEAVPGPVYRNFMDWVIAQNGGYSNDPLFACAEGDKFCFSGLLDLDGRYYDHHGNPGFGPQGPVDQSTLGGVGVRAAFGPPGRTVVGSINNANAFIDLHMPYSKIHTNLAYVNGSVFTNSYTWEYGADWGSVYRLPASLKVDELYLVIANPDLLPIYFKIGRLYADFGDYIPNGYGIQTITPSLTQMMTQTRTGAGQIGLVHPSGFYGSLTMSYAAQSFAVNHRPADLVTRTGIGSNSRNISSKLGYKNTIFNISSNLNVSYMNDLRDLDYINDTLWFMQEFTNIPLTYIENHFANKQGGLAYHADFYLCPFGLSFEGMYSTGKLNPGIDTNSGEWDSHVRTGGVEGWVDFKTLDRASSLRLAYQWARHTQVIGGSIFGGRPSFHNMLPRTRWQGTYTISVLQHINLGFQWVYDHDFDVPRNGTDMSSNLAVARIDVEF